MKIRAALACVALFSTVAFAQRHRGFGVVQFSTPAPAPSTYGSTTGFGRVVFPGTGHAPAPRNVFSITDTTFASRLGATVGGGFGGGYTGRGFQRYRQPAIVPYPIPVYVGAGYGDYPYQPDPNVGLVPQQPAPQVIINQNFIHERATPVMREYTDDGSGGIRVYEAPGRAPVEASTEDGTNYYLIAFKDHSIYSAFAYWVEGDTLHYVTAQRVHNQASLSLLDRDLTEKLNRDRSMQVKLPR
jgi:hypothetical protein